MGQKGERVPGLQLAAARVAGSLRLEMDGRGKEL